MRRALGRWLRAAGATDQEIYEALVAAGEACANAIAHAYPPGEASYVVEAVRVTDGIEIRVRDFGSWRAPRSGSQGRGLELIEELMDDVEIDRGPTGTTVRMRRALGEEKVRRMRDRIAGFEFAEHDGGVVVASVEGEIDSSNAAELRLALSERLPSTSSSLVLDLSDVTYLDSSGIHLLFDLGRRLAARRQQMRLVVPVQAPMRRVLELCAVDSVAPMDESLDLSLASLGAGDWIHSRHVLRSRLETIVRDYAADILSCSRLRACARLLRARFYETRVAEDHEARKRSMARSRRGSMALPPARTSPTRVAKAWSRSISLRPTGSADPRGEGDHAEQAPAADDRGRDHGAALPGVARVLKQLRSAVERRASEGTVAEGDRLREVGTVVAAAGLRGSVEREPIFVGEVDRAAVDVVELDQPVEHPAKRLGGRAGGRGRCRAGAGAGGGLRGRRCLARDLVALKCEGDGLRAGGGAELRHRVAHMRANRLGGEHQTSGDLGTAEAIGKHAENLAFAPGERDAGRAVTSRCPAPISLRRRSCLAQPLVSSSSRPPGTWPSTQSTSNQFEVMQASFRRI